MKVNIIIFFLIMLNINLFATFSKEGDIVRDSKTNLMWQDNDDVKNNLQYWSEALEYCEALALGDYSNWRLPNIVELLSIGSRSSQELSSINKEFENISSSNAKSYWSATTYAKNNDMAWRVRFNRSGVSKAQGHKTRESFSTRCVRSE